MLSAPKTPAPAATLGNLDAKKIATNEQSIPLPYFSGRRWLSLIWAQSNIYRVKAQPLRTKVGKEYKTTGYSYEGDLVGLLGCCRLDYLEEIEVAGVVVWGGAISRDGAHPHHSGDIVVPGVGTFRLYWGTADQPADDLVLAGCGEPHPRYLDQPFLVVKSCAFGNNSTTPPTIRVKAERAAYFAGLDENRSREGANPVTTIAEVLTNDFYGLGLPAGVVDLASWSALAAAIVRLTPVPLDGAPGYEAPMGYISPYLERTQRASTFIAQILEHFDGWIRPLGSALKIGQFPHDGVTPVGLTELSYHDFTTRPKFEPADDEADNLITEVIVSHIDRDDEMEKAATPVPNPAARRRLGFSNPRTFQRPFVITTYQAMEQGNQLSRHYSRDEEACDVSIRREKLGALRAGDRFILTDSPSASSQVVRIVSRVDPADGGEAQLSLVLERGLAPLAFVPPPNPRPILPDPGLVNIVNARVFQFPPFGEYRGVPTVAILAERPAAHIAGYKLHFSTADVTYDEMGEEGRWALRGTLAAGVNAAAASFTVNASGFDLALLAAQSNAARDDDTLLAFIGTEICSIGNVVALGGGQYTVDVLRGRRSSIAAAHALNAELFILPRAEVRALQHVDFPAAGGIRYFKLASYTRHEEQSLAAALKLTYNFAATTVPAPTSILLASGNTTVFLQPDGTAVPRLQASWTPSSDASLQARGQTRIEYKRSAAPSFSDWALVPVAQASTIVTDVLAGTDYIIRVRHEIDGLVSAWLTSGAHTVQGDTTAPGAPTGLAATAYPGYNALSWTPPVDRDVQYGEFYVYRNTVNDGPSATLIGKTRDLWFDDSAATPGVPVWYFIAAEDTSENLGPKSASATCTTLDDPATDTTPANPTAATKTGEGTRMSGDGTATGYFELSVPALPAGAIKQNVELRVNVSGEFQIVAQLKNTGAATVRVENLIPGITYQVGTRAWSASKGSDLVLATGSPFTAPADSTTPNPPTVLSLVANAGHNTVKWTRSTSADIFEYHIFRHTADDANAATKIGDNSGNFFNDDTAVAGTRYWYWVASKDASGNLGARTPAGDVVTSSVPPTDVVPTNPTAATKTGEVTYLSGDGTAFAKLLFTVPALPANARWQNLLYRKSDDTQWMVAGQFENAAQITDVPLDDLTPGISYAVATQAFSAHGRASAVVAATGSPFTAPNKTAGPAAPPSGSLAADSTAPAIKSDISGPLFGCRVTVNFPADKDIAAVEIKATFTDSDAAVDYTWSDFTVVGIVRLALNQPAQSVSRTIYNGLLQAGFVRARLLDKFGNASGWLRIGNANGAAVAAVGDMAVQGKTNVTTSGIRVGNTGASSVVKILAKYEDSIVKTLAGGAPTEAWQESIANRGFGTKPDYGSVNYQNGNGGQMLMCWYDYDDAANSSTIAVIRVMTLDGSNITGGNTRLAVNFQEKD